MSNAKDFKEEFKVRGEEMVQRIKQLIHEGNVRRIIIKNEGGHTILEIPLSIGLIGTALLPIWAALGALAALTANYTIEVVRRNGESPPTDETEVVEEEERD